jgi:hypothetical protein
MTDFNLTTAYITSLTGSPDTSCFWLLIDEHNKKNPPVIICDSFDNCNQILKLYNDSGYGVFIAINSIRSGCPRTLENVEHVRAQVVDIDNPLQMQDSYNRAIQSACPPHFAVQTSPGHIHLYWLTEPYVGNDFFKIQQQKLNQLYNGDMNVTDATRVMRVPGFNHCKSIPQLVTCWGIHSNPRYTTEQMQNYLADVNIVEHNFGLRKKLGNEMLQAPNFELLLKALYDIDPNELSRDEWLSVSASFKQAGWSLTNENNLYTEWLKWCSNYKNNNPKENKTLWNSLKETQIGWKSLLRKTENIQPVVYFGERAEEDEKEIEVLGDVLDERGKKIWFKNCYFVESEGRIFTSSGRFMNQIQFNGRYGGKEFTIKSAGTKLTDNPWKAALSSVDWSIPKVDHCRFLPQEPTFSIIHDDLGRKGLNTYIPAKIKSIEGDVSKWKDYLSKVFNTPEDVKIFEDYIAHCIKFPGDKIPWSVLLQSTKGVGKQMIGDVLKHSIGEIYTYQPDAEELVSGVSQFNGWMRNKLMILVDEVRVGDRNELMNGLKTIITDRRIAVESKGVDQQMEDNVANWIFFSNFKDAFPIDENERRYCIFYSKLQSALQLEEVGMNKNYFDSMYNWLECEHGFEKIAWYYLNYPIEKGSLSHRAPHTSSYEEVLRIGRSPLRVILDDKIEAEERGFRGGYVSFVMFQKAVLDSSMRTKPAEHTLKAILEGRGYHELGRTIKPIPGEDLTHPSLIFGLKGKSIDGYEDAQG